MRLKFPIVPLLRNACSLVARIRWRDPLVQTWGLVGGLLVMGIVSHYVPGRASGEKKNLSPAEALFLAKGPLRSESWRPGVPFSPETGRVSAPVALSAPDLRACADRAARNSGWQHVAPALLRELRPVSEGLPRITVTWSGTRGGDAGALDLYHQNTLGQASGVPEDFVIGNGCRGKDGLIEVTPRWARTLAGAEAVPGSTEISICLVGEGQKATSAQEAALGELITAIEARTGTTALAMRLPRHEGLLAAVEGR